MKKNHSKIFSNKTIDVLNNATLDSPLQSNRFTSKVLVTVFVAARASLLFPYNPPAPSSIRSKVENEIFENAWRVKKRKFVEENKIIRDRGFARGRKCIGYLQQFILIADSQRLFEDYEHPRVFVFLFVFFFFFLREPKNELSKNSSKTKKRKKKRKERKRPEKRLK